MAISIFSYNFVNKLTFPQQHLQDRPYLAPRLVETKQKMYYSFLSLKMINFLPWVARVAQW